jgi:hypothetical protein
MKPHTSVTCERSSRGCDNAASCSTSPSALSASQRSSSWGIGFRREGPLIKQLEAIQVFPRPLDVKGLQGFLSLINFHRIYPSSSNDPPTGHGGTARRQELSSGLVLFHGGRF